MVVNNRSSDAIIPMHRSSLFEWFEKWQRVMRELVHLDVCFQEIPQVWIKILNRNKALNEWVHDLYSLQLYNSEFDLPQIWRMVRSDDTQSELVPSIDLNVSLYICNMYIWIYLYYIYLCMFVLAMYLMDGEERWYAERTGAIYLSRANTSHQKQQTFEVQTFNTFQLEQCALYALFTSEMENMSRKNVDAKEIPHIPMYLLIFYILSLY